MTRSNEIVRVGDANSKEAYIYISNALGNKLSISNKEKIKVNSINGKSSEFISILTDDVPIDMLYAPIHYIETNNLTLSIYDPYSKEPSYKYAPVNIEKLA